MYDYYSYSNSIVKLLTFNLPPPGPSFLKEIFVSSGGNKNLVLEGDKIASFGGSALHVCKMLIVCVIKTIFL